MELTKQVVSLALAKRLKSLGVRQNSYFCYIKNQKGRTKLFLRPKGTIFTHYAAFTVAELGRLLPAYVRQPNSGEMVNLQMQKLDEEKYVVSIMSRTDQVYGVRGETEADARAKMLIYLIENNLLSPTEEDTGEGKGDTV